MEESFVNHHCDLRFNARSNQESEPDSGSELPSSKNYVILGNKLVDIHDQFSVVEFHPEFDII